MLQNDIPKLSEGGEQRYLLKPKHSLCDGCRGRSVDVTRDEVRDFDRVSAWRHFLQGPFGMAASCAPAGQIATIQNDSAELSRRCGERNGGAEFHGR